MNMHDTDCCAIQEICGISSHASAKSAMIKFCQINLAVPVSYYGSQAPTQTLFSFYLFTSACRDTVADNNYGHLFAEYIRKNDLGEVFESQAIVNIAFHDDHANQVFIWTPYLDGVVAWWDKNNPKKHEFVPMISDLEFNKSQVEDDDYACNQDHDSDCDREYYDEDQDRDEDVA